MLWLLSKMPSSVKLLVLAKVIGMRARKESLQKYMLRNTIQEEMYAFIRIWKALAVLAHRNLIEGFWHDEMPEITVELEGEYAVLTLTH